MGKPISQGIMERVVQATRMYVRDLPNVSKRYEGIEVYTSDDMEFAVDMALDVLNSTPPITFYSAGEVPFQSWLIKLTALNLMETRLIFIEREKVTAQDPGGVTADDVEWQSLSRRLMNERQMLLNAVQAGKSAVLMRGYLNNAGGMSSVYGGYEWNE